MEPLTRNQYLNLDTGQAYQGSTSRAESLIDHDEYIARLHETHGAGFHSWGIAEGLAVSASIGAAQLLVQPGAALDRQGRSVVLAVGGWAVIDPDADPDEVENIDTEEVVSEGISLPTAGLAEGNYWVTIRFRETFEKNGHLMRHTPWLLLQPTFDADDESAVVLALVTIDASGNVNALMAGNDDHKRRLAGLPAGSLTLRRPRLDDNPRTVGQDDAVELRPRDDGGLNISTSQPGSPETMVPRLSIDEAGNVVIGPDGKKANLHVSGDMQLDGDADLRQKLKVAGDADLGGKLTVEGDANLAGTLTVRDVAVTGMVDGRRVSDDGSKLDAHVDDKNAHGISAHLADYLPLIGGQLSGPLTVYGNVDVAGKVNGRDVPADGRKLDDHLNDNNAHGIAAQLAKYLPLAGGQLSGALKVTGNVDVAGKVNSRDVAADGRKLDDHLNDNNAHGIATQLAKYLPLAGGQLSGALKVTGNVDVAGKVNGRDVTADGRKLDDHLNDNNAHGIAAQLAKYLPSTGGAVSGQLTVGGDLTIKGNVGLLFKAAADDPGDIVFQDVGGVQKGRIWSKPERGAGLYLSSGDNTPDIAIDANGRVGIGTTDPKARLSLGGAAKQALLIHQNDSANVRAGFGIDMGSGGRELDIFFPGGGKGGHLSIGTVTEDGQYTYSEKVRVTESGSVGIGTSQIPNRLQISGGDLAIGDNVHRAGKIRLWQETDNSSDSISHGIGTEAHHNVYGAGARYASSVGHKFYRGGGELIAQLGFGGSGKPADRLNSYFAGNVGIGTTTPKGSLHVEGWIVMHASANDATAKTLLMQCSENTLIIGGDWSTDGGTPGLYFYWKDRFKKVYRLRLEGASLF